MTREQLDELDLTDGDTHIIAYIDRLTAERDRLRAALRKMIVALRIQARLALSVGGDIALNEGNASAWKQAEAALPKEAEG